MDRSSSTNAPTAEFIRSMREVAVTLNSSSTSLLGVAVRLVEAGQDKEAMELIELVKGIHEAEDKVRRHAKDAGVGKIVKFNTH
jgi:hypothetical protein